MKKEIIKASEYWKAQDRRSIRRYVTAGVASQQLMKNLGGTKPWITLVITIITNIPVIIDFIKTIVIIFNAKSDKEASDKCVEYCAK